MKKLICILLAALLMISIISGCSKSTGTSSGTQEQGSHEGSGGPGKPPEGHGGPGGSSGGDIDYKGAVEITEKTELTDETVSSSDSDESAILISSSDEVTIENVKVEKSGDSDCGDDCNFYGLNAGILVKGGSVTTISGSTITTDAEGANGVFSYGDNGGNNGGAGDGTTVIIKDSTITTTGNGSGGIMTTGGGITYAYDLTVTTSGRSSAAIRTDRGGGQVYVDGGF